eukprot:Sspe_Gene.35538::Locus_17216_Transcript_1_1_Confidence_1.000_Length_1749::g.35538::m.35538
MKFATRDPFGWDAAFFIPMSESTGVDLEQIRFLFCVFAGFPVSSIQSRLPPGLPRYLWALAWGVAESLACFGYDSFHPFISALVAYLMIRFAPTRIMPMMVTVFLFVYMSCSHIYAMLYEYLEWNLDYTTAQMILTVKVTALAWNIGDGALLDKAKYHPKSDNEKDSVPPDAVPNFIEYFSFIFFYPTYVAGPALPWMSYRDWMNSTKKVPSTWLTMTLWKFGGAVTLILMNQILVPMLPSSAITEPLGTGKMTILTMPLLVRLLYTWIAVALARTKYFLVWYLCDTVCIYSGFGFNGRASGELAKKRSFLETAYANMFAEAVDSEGNLWNRCSNGNYWRVETAQSIKDITDNWNIGVNNWLKSCFYFRLVPIFGERSQVPVLLVQVISAFWHGFYPGYYLFFVSGTFYTIVGRNARLKIRPLAIKMGPAAKRVYDFFGWVGTCGGINCLGVPFIFLKWDVTLQVWKDLYFIPHIAAAAVYVVCLFLPSEKRAKKE